jgi:short-subunit dehydrogenase
MSPSIPHPRSIVITGASNGMGAALALAYAQPGATLGLLGRDQARLSEVASRCQAKGAHVRTGSIDITDESTLESWLLAFDQNHPVDLLVANAGIAHTLTGADDNEDRDAICKMFDVNTYGTLNTVIPLMARMRARRRGQIGIVSSLSAYVGMPISPAYCGSKAAIKVYGEALRGWLAPQGVGVTVICPGFVESDMSDRFPGPTPFKVSPQRAAAIIQRGLARNQARVAFPFPLAFSMWFLALLPTSLSLALQRLFRFA